MNTLCKTDSSVFQLQSKITQFGLDLYGTSNMQSMVINSKYSYGFVILFGNEQRRQQQQQQNGQWSRTIRS